MQFKVSLTSVAVLSLLADVKSINELLAEIRSDTVTQILHILSK